MIVAGFGFRDAARVESLMDALALTGVKTVDAIATAQDKSDSATFVAFAQTIGARIIPVAPCDLSAAPTTTRSQASHTHRNTGSVSEAAALWAAGKDARLLAPRFVSHDRLATCAIAKGPKT